MKKAGGAHVPKGKTKTKPWGRTDKKKDNKKTQNRDQTAKRLKIRGKKREEKQSGIGKPVPQDRRGPGSGKTRARRAYYSLKTSKS